MLHATTFMWLTSVFDHAKSQLTRIRVSGGIVPSIAAVRIDRVLVGCLIYQVVPVRAVFQHGRDHVPAFFKGAVAGLSNSLPSRRRSRETAFISRKRFDFTEGGHA
jgi:hypothetical protein